LYYTCGQWVAQAVLRSAQWLLRVPGSLNRFGVPHRQDSNGSAGSKCGISYLEERKGKK